MPSGNSLEELSAAVPAVRQAKRRKPQSGGGLLGLIDRFFDRCYRLMYGLGAQVVRRERRINRRLETWVKRRRDKLAEKGRKRREAVGRRCRAILRDVCAPFLNMRASIQQYKERVAKAKELSKSEGAHERLLITWEITRFSFHIFCKVLNYVAPAAAIVFLVATVTHFNSLNFALSVSYGGQELGYIADESVFVTAEKEVQNRIVTGTQSTADGTDAQAAQTTEAVYSFVPQYSLAVVEPHRLIDTNTLTNRIIQASGDEITQASGIYVSGKFRGATTEPEQVLDIMNSMLNRYETGTAGETIHFINKVEIRDGLYPVQSLKNVDDFQAMLTGNTVGESYYTVVEGDSPSFIASKVGLPLSELRLLNPELEDNFSPGKQLLISRSVPMMKIQVNRRETYEEEIPFDTTTVESLDFIKGYNEITSPGVPGINVVEANVTYIDGVAVSSTVIKKTPTKEPINAIRTVGLHVPSAGSSTAKSGFIWPVAPAAHNYISCPIYGYWGHMGTDIAAPSGTAIYASMAGTVTVATQSYSGYGLHVVINHGNGLTTLYGHCSALLVKPGQYVQQGQVIALVGRTGRATGNHCHFEVRQNGSALDARKYIGYSAPY